MNIKKTTLLNKNRFSLATTIFLCVSMLLALIFAITSTSCTSNYSSGLNDDSADTFDNDSCDNFLTLIDTCGRKVQIPKNASRIVALSPSDVEVLYDLQAQDKIIAKGSNCDYPDAANSISCVGSGAYTNIEKIVSYNPDVVLMSKMNQTIGEVEALERANIPVLVNEANTIDKVYEYISLLGDVSDSQNKASNIIESMKEKFNKCSHPLSGKSVYFDISPDSFDLWTAGNNTLMNDICNIIGIKNVFDDLNDYANVSSEAIIKKNPDYIICVHESSQTEDDSNYIEQICSRSGWQNISAIKNNNVYCINDGSITRPVPRLADAAEELYDIVYSQQ